MTFLCLPLPCSLWHPRSLLSRSYCRASWPEPNVNAYHVGVVTVWYRRKRGTGCKYCWLGSHLRRLWTRLLTTGRVTNKIQVEVRKSKVPPSICRPTPGSSSVATIVMPPATMRWPERVCCKSRYNDHNSNSNSASNNSNSNSNSNSNNCSSSTPAHQHISTPAPTPATTPTAPTTPTTTTTTTTTNNNNNNNNNKSKKPNNCNHTNHIVSIQLPQVMLRIRLIILTITIIITTNETRLEIWAPRKPVHARALPRTAVLRKQLQ